MKTEEVKVKLFKKKKGKRPYFICRICHRCFYSRSVRLISVANYKDFKIHFVTKATYDDGKVYVSMTCHKSIMKKSTLCQAVSNKLDLEVAPKLLQNLGKLEELLIPKKILFKKVAAMRGKEEFAKIEGNIGNIPVETDTDFNVLPRPVSTRL